MNTLNNHLNYSSKNQGIIFITCLLFVVVISSAIIQLIFHMSEHKKQYRDIHQSLDNRLYQESSIYHSLKNIPHILKNITLDQPYIIDIESPFIFQTQDDHLTTLQTDFSAKILAKKLFTNSSQHQGYSSNVFNNQSYQLFILSPNNISNSMAISAVNSHNNFLTINCLTINSDYQDQTLFKQKTLHTISTNHHTTQQSDIKVFRYKIMSLNSVNNISFVRQSVLDNSISFQYTIAPSFTLIEKSYDIFSSKTNDESTVHALFFTHANDKLHLIIINDHIDHQPNNQTIDRLFDLSASPQELTIEYSNINNVIVLNTGLDVANINLDSLKSVTLDHKQFIFIEQKHPQTNDAVLSINYHPSTFSVVVKNQQIASSNIKAKVEVKANSSTLSTPLSLIINNTEIFNEGNNQCTVTSIY